jgi:hypothetical protein
MKLVTFCVATEIVVIVENQYACLFSSHLLKVKGSTETTDSTAYDNQIVRFTEVSCLPGLFEEIPVSHGVRNFERSNMTSA